MDAGRLTPWGRGGVGGTPQELPQQGFVRDGGSAAPSMVEGMDL